MIRGNKGGIELLVLEGEWVVDRERVNSRRVVDMRDEVQI